MELGKQSRKNISNALKSALDKLNSKKNQVAILVSDIHLQPLLESGQLCVFDDDDDVLARTSVSEWADSVPEDFYAMAERQLRPLVAELEKSGALERLGLMRPYSFVLVDDERETVADLLLVDDDTMLLDNGLLKGLDEELDAFLKQLLEE